MKYIDKHNLIIRDSRPLPYANTLIWCAEFDSLSTHTDIAVSKFLRELSLLKRPSSPSLIAVNLNETLVTQEFAMVMVSSLTSLSYKIKRVAFVGASLSVRAHMSFALKRTDCFFAYGFFSDYEQAKIWLVSK